MSTDRRELVGEWHQTEDTIGCGAVTYDFAVYGPNGFLRTLAGGFAGDRSNLAVKASYEKKSEAIVLAFSKQRTRRGEGNYLR
jgi:hypothetical protein